MGPSFYKDHRPFGKKFGPVSGVTVSHRWTGQDGHCPVRCHHWSSLSQVYNKPSKSPGVSLLTRTVGGSFCRQGEVSRAGWGGVDRN